MIFQDLYAEFEDIAGCSGGDHIIDAEVLIQGGQQLDREKVLAVVKASSLR